ncbi:MAG: septum formation initiator family protein [Oscillospiraceae bacterium]|nr:septum formation initiator family protein [Oscillospiraceae bacterium]
MKFRKTGLIPKICILAIIVYAVISIVGVKGKISTAEDRRNAVADEVEALASENAELRYNLEHADDDDVLISIARSKLGLVMPGEEIYYDTGN